jgi:acetyl esterase/lipase
VPLTDSAVSPIYGQMRGLCPITVTVGTADLTHPDCERFALACEAAGVDVSMLVSNGGFHVFIAATALREAKIARRFVSSRISGGTR